ncbi:MAG TPA: hypothetical protein VN824_23075 [Puia sp.]|nr:hypothetical protein [Puia sp.]
MNDLNYIISSCTIGRNSVIKDDTCLYAQAKDLSERLLSIYRTLKLDYPKFYKMDQLSKLGWLASEILLKDNPIPDTIQPEDIGIVLTNANASLDTDIKYLDTVADIASPAVFVYTLPNIMIGEISIRNKFKGENAFFIFDKFDAGFLELYVGQLLDTGVLKACICGWVDVFGDDYKAALFLVARRQDSTVPSGSKSPASGSVVFSKQNMDKIFRESEIEQ